MVPAAARAKPRSRHPKRLFLLLCVFGGTVLGLLGTQWRDRNPARAPERAPAMAELAKAEAPPARAPAPPPADAAKGAPVAAPPAKPAPAAVTKELKPGDVQVVMQRLVHGRPLERDEAERFLVFHRAETETTVRAALETRLDPAMRAALEYVAVSIDEEEGDKPQGPTVLYSAPERGLVLVCDSLEATEDLAMVRRTGKASLLETTVVFVGAGEASKLAKTYAPDLGDVRFYVDTDGGFVKRHKPERFPAVLGLDGGRAVSILYGRVRRSVLAELAAKLVK
jgi:hypothetical protein